MKINGEVGRTQEMAAESVMALKASRSKSDPISGPDRRNGPRTTTIYRPATIRMADFHSFCLVRNISAEGIMATVYSDIPVGAPLQVEFNSDFVVDGSVVWSTWPDERRIGIRFYDAIDVSCVLTALGSLNARGRIIRGPRLQLRCEGTMEVEGFPERVEVQDISPCGLKVRASRYLVAGEEFMIQLDGLDRRKAVVCWSRLGQAGLRFVRPYGVDELAEWAVHHQSASRDDGAEGSR